MSWHVQEITPLASLRERMNFQDCASHPACRLEINDRLDQTLEMRNVICNTTKIPLRYHKLKSEHSKDHLSGIPEPWVSQQRYWHLAVANGSAAPVKTPGTLDWESPRE